MAGFRRVARVEEVPSGTAKMVMGPFDKPMALFNVTGTFYAVNYICPHMGGPLSEGFLEGTVVSCPWHGWSFDIRDGKADHPGGHGISAYETRVEGGFVLVGWLKLGSGV